MKKIIITPVQLYRVVLLRETGFTWTEIERATKLERRIAKRSYNELVEDKKRREPHAARFRVAAILQHKHLQEVSHSVYEECEYCPITTELMRFMSLEDENTARA